MGTRRIATLAGAAMAVTAVAAGGIALADNDAERLKARLAGVNELPPTDPDGEGRARVDLDVEGGQVCWDIRFDDAGAPNRGHIHIGDAQTSGGIAVTLFELVGQPAQPLNDDIEDGRAQGCASATPEVLAAIAANPGGYYVNLHNARFPGGAMRGQLDG